MNGKLANSEVIAKLDLRKKVVEEYSSKYESENKFYAIRTEDYHDFILRCVYEEDRDKVWSAISYEALLENYYSGNSKISIEYRRRMPKGEIRWFAVTAIIIEGIADESLNAFMYAHDIDDKMKERIAKNKIIDMEVDNISLVHIKSGMSRNLKLYDGFNLEFSVVHHYDEVLTHFCEMEIVKEDCARCKEFFSLKNLIPAVSKNQSASISFWMLNPRGNNKLKTTTVTYLDNTHEDLLLVGRDITDLFEKEKEQQMALQHAVELADFANRAKSDFLSRMSHDMRTPLNAVLGLVKLAINEETDPQIQDYLWNINSSGEFLLGLINDTLDLSKIESGKMELHRETYPLEDFVRGISAVIQPLMDEKGITFNVNLKKQLNRIIVDRMRFNQVFYNLLSNAAKYTPAGGTVDFWSENIPPKGDKFGMRFHVKDSGIGMSDEFQKVLFEPFSQEFGEAHKEQKGTGLGLAIVKQIVDLAEGQIKVISAPGKGTEFIVDLYANSVESQDAEQKKLQYDPGKLRGIHVLLADDTAINTLVVKKLLGYQGCIVDVAENGQKALEMFSASQEFFYDIILTDLRMPMMDGFEEARQIRALHRKDASSVPMIAATADAYDDMLMKIKEAGINERLIKPIDGDVLCESIIRLTESRNDCRMSE